MADDFGLISTKELEAVTGHKIEAKAVFVLAGARLFHREYGRWREYGDEHEQRPEAPQVRI